MTIYDVIGSLEELGVSMDELSDYAGGEAKELARYAVWSGRRVEDFNELKGR